MLFRVSYLLYLRNTLKACVYHALEKMHACFFKHILLNRLNLEFFGTNNNINFFCLIVHLDMYSFSGPYGANYRNGTRCILFSTVSYKGKSTSK
jgi:hypothetical protein